MKVTEVFATLTEKLKNEGGEVLETHISGPDVGLWTEPWVAFELFDEILILQADLESPGIFVKDWENQVLWRYDGVPGDKWRVLGSFSAWLEEWMTNDDLQAEGL